MRILMLGIAVSFFAGSAWAQSADIAGGYSFINFDAGADRETIHGWMGNVSGNLTGNVGLVADVSGQYENGFSVHTYMAGVRYNGRAAGVNPFAEALFGATRVGDGSSSSNDLTMGFGGGLDVRVNDWFSVRTVQVDWLPMRSGSSWETSIVRFGFGGVVHVP
jgi:hypothetical protein